jgi:tetratricopeptide (TPR) repeat protein
MATDEQVDLEPDRKSEILELDAKLTSANLFELLGVAAGASVDEVRNAFRELSRKFHPDRYFGKNLGSFRPRLDRIFKRLVEANQTLSDPERRQAYLDANPFVRAAAKASGNSVVVERAAPKTLDEQKRDAERRQRLARHPYLMKVGKVQDAITRAKEAIAKKEFSQAFTHLNFATQADPQNSEVKTLLAEVRRQNDFQRAEGNYKHGLEAVERGDELLAIQAFKAAAGSGHGPAAYKTAILLEKHGADTREAISFAQKAVEADPTHFDYRVLAGRLLDDAGMKALAKKHFEEAQKLHPDHPELKKHVKKRWPF